MGQRILSRRRMGMYVVVLRLPFPPSKAPCKFVTSHRAPCTKTGQIENKWRERTELERKIGISYINELHEVIGIVDGYVLDNVLTSRIETSRDARKRGKDGKTMVKEYKMS